MDLGKTKECINPNGEHGLCYQFDRFGDRSGCLGCSCYTQEMFNQEDPLPGLTKMINKGIEGEPSQKYKNTVAHVLKNGTILDCYTKSYHYILSLETLLFQVYRDLKQPNLNAQSIETLVNRIDELIDIKSIYERMEDITK